MELSKDQKQALREIISWYFDDEDKKFFTLGGLAGSGKTFLIRVLEDEIQKRELISIAHCAYTGKAANVMRTKGINNACTIHSLIYKPIKEGEKVRFVKIPVDEMAYKLIVVDEASMVSEEIFNDLMSYGKKILFVGDYGQLDPVGSKFNLMQEEDLDFKLTTIHRQALENPIIRLSLQIREGRDFDYGNYENKFYKMHPTQLHDSTFLRADQVICGSNKRRKELNDYYRELKRYYDMPKKDERLIILRNNNFKGYFNGQQIIVDEDFKQESTITLMGKFHDPLDSYKIGHEEQFWMTNLYNCGYNIKEDSDSKDTLSADYAYCISVHKSQGSEWDKVILIDDEGFLRWDYEAKCKWLYTAFTRAKDKMVWVG